LGVKLIIENTPKKGSQEEKSINPIHYKVPIFEKGSQG